MQGTTNCIHDYKQSSASAELIQEIIALVTNILVKYIW